MACKNGRKSGVVTDLHSERRVNGMGSFTKGDGVTIKGVAKDTRRKCRIALRGLYNLVGFGASRGFRSIALGNGGGRVVTKKAPGSIGGEVEMYFGASNAPF